MNADDAYATIVIDPSASLVAIVTLVTVLVFSLATLPRPSRATISWAIAFGLGLLGTYMWVAAQQMDEPALRAAASGLMVCFEPIVWLGLRFHFGRRPSWWPVIAFVLVTPGVLAATASTPSFQVAFRLVFLAAGFFAALIAYELFRNTSPRRDIRLPLALASCAFAVVAIAGAAFSVIETGMSAVLQLEVIREVNGVGTLVISTCAAFTLVLLVRADGPRDDAVLIGADRARRRLAKARAQGDKAWSILDVRLDYPIELREASTGAGFGRLVDRFHDDVAESLPASADAERVADDRSIVIIHGSDEAVEHHVRGMLRRISAIEGEGASARLRLSASVGCASAGVVGYDYDEMVAAAAEAAMRASDRGGDRWERVKKVPTTLER